ncbi:hypothetical protein Tco_0832598 [Tanacetum coccineum]
MTPATISSGLVPNPPPSTPFVPPSRTDWDILFQLMFDDYYTESSNQCCIPNTQSSAIQYMKVVCSKSSMSCERLGVWELVPRPDKVMVITLKWIYKVKLDELGALESLKKYGFDSYDPVDTPMVEKSKLDEDKEGKTVNPSHYRGMIGTLLYLTASRPDLQFAICMCARSKHIDIRFHFIKEHVENGMIELYFVNKEYQLADIFTKALARERIELSLTTSENVRSFPPKTLKQLADEVDE